MFLKKFLKRKTKEKMNIEGKIVWKRVYRDFLIDKERKYSFTTSSSYRYVICFVNNNNGDYYIFGVYKDGVKFQLNLYNHDSRNIKNSKNEVTFSIDTYEYKILKRLFDKIQKKYELKDKVSFYEGIRKI